MRWRGAMLLSCGFLCACGALFGIDSLENVDCVGDACADGGADGRAHPTESGLDGAPDGGNTDALQPDAATPCANDASVTRDCTGVSTDICNDVRHCGDCNGACADPSDETRACIEGRCVDFTFVHWTMKGAGDFVVTDAGDVLDRRTSMLWRRRVGEQQDFSDGAYRACHILGGHWRLPTRVELASVIRYDLPPDASIDPTLFPGAAEGLCFWSLSQHLGQRFSADLVRGLILNQTVFAQCDVRCVKRFAGASADRFDVDVASDTVYDRVTNLTWQRRVNPNGADADTVLYTQTEAENACASPNRLPTIQELYTIVDERVADAAAPILAEPFAGEPVDGEYISANRLYGVDGGDSWVLIKDGRSVPSGGGYRHNVRCVRDGR